MTGMEYDGVDFERLADYVAGALDGTSDEAVVADLVATDPAWTRAHAMLVAADAFVRTDLAVLANQPEPVPDDVAARLDAALAAQPPFDAAAEPAPADGRKPALTVLRGGVHGAPADARRVPSGSRRARQVRRRWGTAVGVAAAAVVVGVGWVTFASPTGESAKSSSRSASGVSRGDADTAHASARPSYVYGAAGNLGVNASGSDYTADSVRALAAPPPAPAGAETPNVARPKIDDEPSQPPVPLSSVPPALHSLATPSTRDACLAAVTAKYGGTPSLVDFARYQEQPALVVLLDDVHGVAGQKWIVVVTPTCGSGGRIGPELYSAQAG